MVVKGNGQLHQALEKLLIFRGSFAPCVLQCLMSFEKAFGIEQVNASAKIVLAHNAFCHGVRLHDYASRPTALRRALMGYPLPPVYENNGVPGAWASKSLSYKGLEAKS